MPDETQDVNTAAFWSGIRQWVGGLLSLPPVLALWDKVTLNIISMILRSLLDRNLNQLPFQPLTHQRQSFLLWRPRILPQFINQLVQHTVIKHQKLPTQRKLVCLGKCCQTRVIFQYHPVYCNELSGRPFGSDFSSPHVRRWGAEVGQGKEDWRDRGSSRGQQDECVREEGAGKSHRGRVPLPPGGGRNSPDLGLLASRPTFLTAPHKLLRHDQGPLRRPVGKLGTQSTSFQHFPRRSSILESFPTGGQAPP